MSSRDIKYYFGRLNLFAVFDDKEKFLLNALNSKKALEYRGFKWGFFEILELKTKLNKFIHGYLVKYKPEFSEEVANPDTHNLEDQSIENFVVAKSRFFIHIKSGVIAYHPDGNNISREHFVERFCRLFEFALDNMFVNAEIQAIEEDYKIFDIIKSFKTIQRLHIYLHPSNPSNRDRWRRTDERLKKIGVIKYSEHYDADLRIGNLNILDDEDINNKITMADDGYGKADVTGYIDGELKTVSTSDNPLSMQAPSDEETPENVLKILLEKVITIFSRFGNED